MSDIAVFEHPLNERYRLFLRAEQIFEQIDHHLGGEDYWDTHAALQAVLELLQTVSRGDSKRELIKELDRQRSAAGTGTDTFDQLLSQLHERTGTLGGELADNELIQQLKQRTTAGGRPGTIGLASYQEWLQRPATERHEAVRSWLAPLEPARAAIAQCLDHLRGSAAWQALETPRGFYEQTLDPREPMQLLRVRLTSGTAHCFPEVSAGRQRFTIRFFEQDTPAERPRQVDGRMEFELACCGPQ
ncbi:MAG: cell division protein ZapD [Halofilum sp. (in: g-proteobacteria)]